MALTPIRLSYRLVRRLVLVGHVIQTVYNSHNTGVTLSSGGAVETGLAASITPKFASS